jgi:hypothetical protein
MISTSEAERGSVIRSRLARWFTLRNATAPFVRSSGLVLGAIVFFSLSASSSAEAASNVPRCFASQLTANVAGARTFGPRRVTRIGLVNNSARSCSLEGYPSLRVTRTSGYVLFILPHETPVDENYQTVGPGSVILGSLRRASFLLGYPRVSSNRKPCVPASNILIGGFARYGTLTVPDIISPCGAVDISPFFVGRAKKGRV